MIITTSELREQQRLEEAKREAAMAESSLLEQQNRQKALVNENLNLRMGAKRYALDAVLRTGNTTNLLNDAKEVYSFMVEDDHNYGVIKDEKG